MSTYLHRASKWGIRAAHQLSQYVHNVDNKPGLIAKMLSYCRSCSISGSCILGCSMCLLSYPLPLCIHGKSCPLGQLPATERCLNILIFAHNHCGARMSISVLCTPMRVKCSVWIVSNIFPEWVSSLGGLLMWTLRWLLMTCFSGL